MQSKSGAELARALESKMSSGASWSNDEVLAIVNDLRLHETELEQQNHDLRATREQLSASLDRYQELYDRAPVGYLTTDVRSTIVEVNLSAAQILGLGREQLVDRSLPDFVLRADQDLFYLHRRAVMDGDRNRACTLRVHGANNAEIWVELISELHVVEGEADSGSREAEIRWVLSDITDRKRLEHQFLQAQKIQALGTLSAGLAHELNNVLAVVLGVATTAKAEISANDRLSDDLEEIDSAARRGKSLLENLLGFARKSGFRREPIIVDELVRGTLRILRKTIRAQVGIETSLLAGRAAISGDPSQIAQAIMNLCLNSAGAMEDAGSISASTREVDIGAENSNDLEAGRYVELRIEDNGAGMTSETLARAFEPFYTTKSIGSGTGLGLSVVHGVARRHGGAVVIASVPGAGTTVTTWWPVVALEHAVSSQPVPGPAEKPSAHANILVVDDEAMIRRTSRRMLESAGYSVQEAADGPAAVLKLQEHGSTIDIVLLDLSMPGMNGAVCFRALIELDARVRVLMCTGTPDFAEQAELERAGLRGVLRKPFDRAQLLVAIERALQDTSSARR